MHWVTEGGKRVRRLTLEIVLLQIRNMAVQGNPRFFRPAHAMLARLGPEEREPTGGHLVVPEVLPLDEWIEAEKERMKVEEARCMAETEKRQERCTRD